VSAQPSRAVACSRARTAFTASCPTPTTSRRFERLKSTRNAGGPEDSRGSRPSLIGLQLAGLEAGAAHPTSGIFRPAEPGDLGLTVRRRRKAASRHRPIPVKMQPGRVSWCTRNHGIGRFLKLENLAIKRRIRDYLVCKYAPTQPCGWRPDSSGSLRPLPAQQRRPTRSSTANGRGWPCEPGQGTGPSSRAARWRFDLVQALCPKRHRAPGSPSRRFWPPGKLELGGFLPLRAAPQPSSKAIKAEGEARHGEKKPQPMDVVLRRCGLRKPKVAIRPCSRRVTAGKAGALLRSHHGAGPSSTGAP